MPKAVGDAWPDAQAAAQLDATGLWAWTKRATASGEEAEWQRLAELVKAAAPTGAHDVLWESLWARIERPAETKADPQQALDEASVLGRAIATGLGDRSYSTRVREYTLAADRVTPRREFIEARLAEARRAWEVDKNAEIARARLATAKASLRHLPEGGESLASAIAALEAELPRVGGR